MITRITIDSKHIDRYGHVNYKTPPAMLEEFQDALLLRQGVTFKNIEEDFGLRSFVKKFEVIWDGELKEGDECLVSTTLELGNTSMKFHQTLANEHGRHLVIQHMVVVLVDGDGKPTSIPTELRKKLGELWCDEEGCSNQANWIKHHDSELNGADRHLCERCASKIPSYKYRVNITRNIWEQI